MEIDLKSEDETYAIESVTSHGKNGSDNHPQQPDTDSVKLFVGQIPRSMTEDQLRVIFEVFGPVYQVIMLKDQGSMQNKGCAFLTFYTRNSAIEAQNALHGNKTLPGMKNPMQVKPANSELKNEEERRLFVGMLPKSMGDNELTLMFAPYGALEDCVILKDRDGQSKGCAFVTYGSRKSAQLAIKSLHHSRTLEGCRMPLVVKPADTQKDKEIKMKQRKVIEGGQNSSPYMSSVEDLIDFTSTMMKDGILGIARPVPVRTPKLSNIERSSFLLLQQAVGGSHLANLNNIGTGMAHQLGSGSNFGNTTSGFGANLNSQFSAQAGPGLSQYPVHNAAQGMNNANPGFQELASALTAIASNPVLQTLLNPNMSLLQQLTSMNSTGAPTSAPGMMQSGQSNVMQQTQGGMFGTPGNASLRSVARPYFNSAKGHYEGPEGCNLFIYHIPEEFRDSDISQIFAPFGNIVSSRIFVDKRTNVSKGFGFVSYDKPQSARNAIQAMNGFQIGNRRLKVELKKPRTESRPY